MWPADIGILAIDVYFPSQYVSQSDLEEYDGVAKGKYTIGLGQDKMSFCTDVEDIYSLSLTVVSSLMYRYDVAYTDIGHLQVGTETILDKSKSVKTVLMQLFEKHENTSIEGADSINACYGGTAAIFNAVQWMESSYWDGRLALVVLADIAVYASGNARSTGGAGAVAILIGPHAPIIFHRGLRSTCMRHVYDFYKPNLSSEYPVVDGMMSIKCYLSALDQCYSVYCDKIAQKLHCLVEDTDSVPIPFTLDSADAFIFHSPYCKLVQKSVGRLFLNDFLRHYNSSLENSLYEDLKKFKNMELSETLLNKNIERTSVKSSRSIFTQKTSGSLLLANQVGNMYTSSLYASLVSHLINHALKELEGQFLVLFSYGSGCAASMFSMYIKNSTISSTSTASNSFDENEKSSKNESPSPINSNDASTNATTNTYSCSNKRGKYSHVDDGGIMSLTPRHHHHQNESPADISSAVKSKKYTLKNMLRILSDIPNRLNRRKKFSPQQFTEVLSLRERSHNEVAYKPISSTSALFPGTWYLINIDDKYRRTYDRIPFEVKDDLNEITVSSKKNDDVNFIDCQGEDVNSKTVPVLSRDSSMESNQRCNELCKNSDISTKSSELKVPPINGFIDS